MTVHPDNGARFECARESVDDAGATYTFIVRLPADVSVTYRARANADRTTDVEQVSVTPGGTEVPAWIGDHAEKLARQLAKSATWPRRFQRWHAPRST